MTDLANQNGCTFWIEKTPGHIYVLDYIEKHIPGIRTIHVIRDGRAVVASLVDAKRRYNRIWKKLSINDFVKMWNKAILISANHVEKRNNLFVSYDSLATNPKRELSMICKFLSLEFEENMLERYQETGASIISSDWPWAKNVQNEIRYIGLEKYISTLSRNDRQFVENNLINLPENLLITIKHDRQ
jgi:hypothetical protein